MLPYVLFAPLCAGAAAETGSAGRFTLRGAGSLSVPVAVQETSRYELRAVAELAGSPAAVQVGGRFVLEAVASANSLVCYNDTVFRDAFDGTGL